MARGELTSEYLFWFALITVIVLIVLGVYYAVSKGLFSIELFGG